MSGPHFALVGPTASGKSALAMEIARANADVELVSVDSMQVYRGMDIGTAKPTVIEQQEIRHHLIDIVEPDHDFGLQEFQTVAREAVADIEARGKRALLVGGTGLYLQAVTDNFTLPGQFPDVREELEREADTPALHTRLAALDPKAAARMEPTNRRRVMRALEVTVGSGRPFSTFGPGIGAYPDTPFRILGLRMDSELNATRIEQRVDRMMERGLVDEVIGLADNWQLAKTARQALGYKEILNLLEGDPSLGQGELAARQGPAPELDIHERSGQESNVARNNCSVRSVDTSAAADDIKRRTRSFARRQRVWFRRDPRITWFDVEQEPLDLTASLLAAVDAPDWTSS